MSTYRLAWGVIAQRQSVRLQTDWPRVQILVTPNFLYKFIFKIKLSKLENYKIENFLFFLNLDFINFKNVKYR